MLLVRLVLAAAILVEEYLGMFLYWCDLLESVECLMPMGSDHSVSFNGRVPFFYLFKFLFFVLLLVPNTKFSHVIYSGFMEPAIDSLAQNLHTKVVPVMESLLLRCVLHRPTSSIVAIGLTRYATGTGDGSTSVC